MTTLREQLETELQEKLIITYKKWQKKYGIGDDDVYYSDGEYDPDLITVLNGIVVCTDSYDDDCD